MLAKPARLIGWADQIIAGSSSSFLCNYNYSERKFLRKICGLAMVHFIINDTHTLHEQNPVRNSCSRLPPTTVKTGLDHVTNSYRSLNLVFIYLFVIKVIFNLNQLIEWLPLTFWFGIDKTNSWGHDCSPEAARKKDVSTPVQFVILRLSTVFFNRG